MSEGARSGELWNGRTVWRRVCPLSLVGSVPSVSRQFGLLCPIRLKIGRKTGRFGTISTIYAHNGIFSQICFLFERACEATKRFSAGNSRRFPRRMAPCRLGKSVTLLRPWRQVVLLVATNTPICRYKYAYLSQQVVLFEATTTPICRNNYPYLLLTPPGKENAAVPRNRL